eukprot:TRINITY_DN2740_c0_g1_i1.p1 TRINITY_DN2740_c0_g1~~TRINITY_DN2740_c0_g1_i1.p1  ORF type:complete len:426 (+),score=107.99 TRINITY_DN2740_c0_g1_i1:72-1280(+)
MSDVEGDAIYQPVDEEDLIEERSLKTQYVSYCRKNNVTPISSFFNSFDAEEISLSHFGLNGKDIECIVKFLPETHIQSLDLANNNAGKIGGVAIGDLLKSEHHIVQLNLSSNNLWQMDERNLNQTWLGDLKPVDVGGMINFSAATTTRKKKVAPKSRLEPEKLPINPLFQSLMSNRSLKMLILDNNRFGDRSMINLFHVVKANRSLEVFSVKNCGFTSASVTALSQLIIENSTLRAIILSENALNDDKLMVEFANAVGENNGLQLLEMNNCFLKTKTMETLIRKLAQSVTLKNVRFDYNDTVLQNGKAFQDFIGNEQNIVEFRFSHNSLSFQAFVQIATLLRDNNSHLQDIDFSNSLDLMDLPSLRKATPETWGIFKEVSNKMAIVWPDQIQSEITKFSIDE